MKTKLLASPKTNIVLVSGLQGSGKSTLALGLLDQLDAQGLEVLLLKFADPIYQLHDAINVIMQSYDLSTPKKDGELLQYLGTEYGRIKYGDDVWVRIAQHSAHQFLSAKPRSSKRIVIIDDCRFPNELNAFPKALKIRLECSEKLRKKRCHSWRANTGHASETALDNHTSKFHRVYNTGVMHPADVLADVLRLLGVSK